VPRDYEPAAGPPRYHDELLHGWAPPESQG